LALFGTTTDENGLTLAKGSCNEAADYGNVIDPIYQPVEGVLKPTLGPMTNGVNSLIYGLDTLTLRQKPNQEPVMDPTDYFDPHQLV
jgi:hypothetical protein